MRRLPYGARYLIALVAWAGVVVGDVFLRIVFVPLLPFAWVQMGCRTTQQGVQLEVTVIEFYARPLMRLPRADWRRLLGRGGRCADQPPEPRFIENVGDHRA